MRHLGDRVLIGLLVLCTVIELTLGVFGSIEIIQTGDPNWLFSIIIGFGFGFWFLSNLPRAFSLWNGEGVR